MSTELKTIQGKIEVPKQDGSLTSNYKNAELNLTRFYGGKERSTSLQLGITNSEGDYSYIQLDNKGVKDLIKELQVNFE